MKTKLGKPFVLGCWVAALAAAAQTTTRPETIFVPVKIDGPAHDPANHSYWFGPFPECASVLDADGDGDLDIAAGRTWYEAPDWIKHENFRDGAETNGPETDDNSEFAMDVNKDGRSDIVSSGWMRMKGAFWYENPGQKDLKWKAHRFHSARNMEGVLHGDMDGDGDDDVLVNHWAPVAGQGMTWFEHVDREPWLIEHVIGTEGEYHGNGRTDIVTPTGWYEAPPKPAEGRWVFHPDYALHSLDDPKGHTPAKRSPSSRLIANLPCGWSRATATSCSNASRAATARGSKARLISTRSPLFPIPPSWKSAPTARSS